MELELEWRRGQCIGHGSFGFVNLAVPVAPHPAAAKTPLPPPMAVKSCSVSNSASLRHEKEVLTLLRDCPNVIRCFGDDLTRENGDSLYNVLIEYASCGSVADRIRSGDGLPESEVRRHTRSILRALRHVHATGFVHCDVKPQNILLCSADRRPLQDGVVAKIADFGLAKRAGTESRPEIRGTPLYMSPESVASGEFESPSDVWALGCAVAEMVSGRPAWRCSSGADVTALLFRIGAGNESPEIPAEISEEGRDFLIRCFARDPRERWTAEMLLGHAFVADLGDDEATVGRSVGAEEAPSASPRGPFDFPEECVSVDSSIPETPLSPRPLRSSTPPATRIGQLATDTKPDWSWSESWDTVRRNHPISRP